MKKILFVLSAALFLAGCAKTESTSQAETVKTQDTQAQTKQTEKTAAEPSAESLTEPQTESDTQETEQSVCAKMSYREVLEDIYYNCKFPEYEEPVKNYDYDISGNEFLVYDIDNDGQNELIFLFTENGMAGMTARIYGKDINGNIIVEFGGFPSLRFYDNGIIEENISHNQGPSGDFWPYTMHQYDADSDTYKEIAHVSSMGREAVEQINKLYEDADKEASYEYPYEADTSNSGIVYFIERDSFAQHIPLDVTEYDEWHDEYTGDANLLDLPFMKLTEENIKTVEE